MTDELRHRKATASIGVTHNLGDFNSLRIDFQDEVYYLNDEDREAALAGLWKAVEDEVNNQLEEATKG